MRFDISLTMDEKFDDRATLLSRIELLERGMFHKRDEQRNDIKHICMQHAEPNYGAVATKMQSQRENVNLQEELSESYRIKNQLADLHATELSKSSEAEKQIKFFQSSVAVAFSERDNAIMEAELAKEKEEHASQQFGILQQKCAYTYVSELWRKKQSDIMRFMQRVRRWEYHQLPSFVQVTHPTQPDKARRMCYKPKQVVVEKMTGPVPVVRMSIFHLETEKVDLRCDREWRPSRMVVYYFWLFQHGECLEVEDELQMNQ
ncbi:hypothetical protein M8C21_027321 [Ambrosia artemisiifolia]|uniref:Ribosomal protein L15 n=1 Tax=Ambrosia artemisiifolia TaxID=4212 RepID=A0AAD5CT57_AMBAR|nr:hypothetical protein M8C21_027321 [Ambrosia artemisiifolia]